MLSAAEIIAIVPALVLGALLGFCGGLFGIGGGIIVIPLLVLGCGMDQAVAQGTALVMMVPNLLIGWWRYSRRHPVPLGRALAIGVTAAVTTWGVAQFAIGLPSSALRMVFSVFLMLLALRLLQQLRRRPHAAHQLAASADAPVARFPEHLLPLVGIVGGASMGLLGIGGGLVATPIFTGLFAQRQTVAQSLSLALVAPSSVIALTSYAHAGRVDWHLGLPLAMSGMFTVSAGVALAHRLPEQRMKTWFAWMLLCAGGWLLLGGWLR